MLQNNDIGLIFSALNFAADKHRKQRRKDSDASPYINHPIAVAHVLSNQGKITDAPTLAAALLHDTLEDTDASYAELCAHFGQDIADLVNEVSDDKNLPKAERKRLQIEHAAHISRAAQHIKLADKICNVRDVINHPPQDWNLARRREYLDWTAQVIAQLRGASAALEAYYDEVLAAGYADLEAG
jgi:guanosine-3',5'-bis(diphosphate) 3'-pyrophosphohydrolase